LKIFFKKAISDFKQKIIFLKYKNTLPINPLHDDIYIVEFPKSGVTWLSFLLGTINLKTNNLANHVTYYNHHKWVIDVHQVAGFKIQRHFSNTFIKSHSAFNPYYYFTIYLIRNPFDVMVSYYNFAISRYGYTKDFDSFVKDKNMGINAWVEHVKSWHHGKRHVQRIHFIRYEELKDNPERSLQDLYINLGITVSTDILHQSIADCDVSKMQNTEAHYQTFNHNYIGGFVGSKGKLAKENILTDDIKKIIIKCAHHQILFFYPELLTLQDNDAVI